MGKLRSSTSTLILASVAVLMTSSAAFAIANPASVFCEKLGGKSVVVTERSGDELGLCRLKNGNLIEEWTLYRLLEGEAPTSGSEGK